jgi:hypothetical protein
MKTQIKSTWKKIGIADFIMFALLFGIVFSLTSCGSDDEVKPAKPDTSSLFVGTYDVQDESAATKYLYFYSIGISKGAEGELYISNFADMLNVPVKATVDGTTLTIKSQTFKNSSGKQIEVSGSGSIVGEELNFTYKTTGYLDYTGTCKALKKQ